MKNRGVKVGAAATTLGLLIGVASMGTASAGPLIRENCGSGFACGWKDANFANFEFAQNQLGDYNLAGTTANNNISSVYNNTSHYAIYYDFAGSTTKLCVPPGFQNQDLAGTTMQDKTSYVQITNLGC